LRSTDFADYAEKQWSGIAHGAKRKRRGRQRIEDRGDRADDRWRRAEDGGKIPVYVGQD